MLACLLGSSGEIFFPKLAKEEMSFFKDITLDFFKASNRSIVECTSEQQAKQLSIQTTDKDPYPVFFLRQIPLEKSCLKNFSLIKMCLITIPMIA